MPHLYDLTEQYLGLARLIEEGEVDEQTLKDTLDGITGSIQVKAENLLAYVSNLNADVDAIDTEVKRLQARKKVITNRQNSLREYLRQNMDTSGISKITCPLFTITLIKPKDMCVVTDVDELPEEYVRTEIKPDKAKILRALKSGEKVPGAAIGKSQAGLMIK